MRCLHCGEELDDDISVCPYCDHEIDDEGEDLDFPTLEEDDFSMEKTRAMSPIHDDELSLIDDINDEINKEEIEEETEEEKEIQLPKRKNKSIGEVNVGDVSLTSNDVNSVLETHDSIKKRKIILIACVILTVFAVILTVAVISKDDKNESIKINGDDYLETYHQALDKYYETGDIDDVVIILQANKNDEERIENIQRKTRVACDSWLLTYIDEKIESKDEFEKVTKNYEEFLYGLNHYAIATVNDKTYKALPDSDYLELSNQFNSVYEDGLIFFDALELYNKKDYNKSYTNFELVDNKNVYYENAVYYKKKIVENVLSLLDKDLEKLEKGIDELSIDDKISRYVAMEEIIMKYSDAYISVNLSQDGTYRSRLDDCRKKIDEYSKMTTDE